MIITNKNVRDAESNKSSMWKRNGTNKSTAMQTLVLGAVVGCVVANEHGSSSSRTLLSSHHGDLLSSDDHGSDEMGQEKEKEKEKAELTPILEG